MFRRASPHPRCARAVAPDRVRGESGAAARYRATHRLVWAAVLLLPCLPGYAADAPPPSTASGLDAARKDLQALPALEHGLQMPTTGAAPVFTVPPLQPAPAAGAPDRLAPSGNPTKKTPAEEARARSSQNWLVDAMMQPDAKGNAFAGRSRALAPAPAAGQSSGLLADDADATEADPVATHARAASPGSASAKSGAAATSAADAPAPPPNPLAGFMRDWISPRDGFLLPVTEGNALGRSPMARVSSDLPATSGGSGLALTTLVPDAGVSPFGEPSGPRAALSPAAPPPNPFLEILTPPAPPAFAPEAAPPAARPAQPAPPAVAPEDSRPRPYIPPPLDDKRLPQVRRF